MERKVNIRFIVLRNYAQYSELIPINAPTLRMDSSGEVKMSLTGDFEANPAVNWLTDEIQPVIEIDGKAVTLDDITYKTLLKWRQVANTSRSDAKTLNTLFSQLLNIPIAVTDKGTMALEIAIDNEIDSSSLIVLRFFSIALKPAGVGINLTIDYASMFGFNGQKLSTFNFGVFNTNSLG